MNLRVGRGQSLCIIGPNGAGKSTVLHAIFGFNRIFSGKILVGDRDNRQDVTALTSSQKLSRAGIAYILQDKSVFPGMTVEEKLWMGGYLMENPRDAKEAAERVFEILGDLQYNEGKTIVMVEQNAKKGLEFADIGYVLVSGEVAVAGPGTELLENPDVGRLFLGGEPPFNKPCDHGHVYGNSPD